MMVLINYRSPEFVHEITGLDRLFLAPELSKSVEWNAKSPLNDVWSIGAMLYLLITGGHKEKEEKFDFSEDQWYYVSDELKDFMHRCVEVDPLKRMTINELLKHDFI